ncbi:MAG: nucleotidyltransferase family protein [Anaerolineae bacterium]|jgi:hypothetical protein|nr:nucleotidyltransferase family protein [Anaerolineae bacterium]
MTERIQTGDILLTPNQRQLLTAALSTGAEAATRAWYAWRDATDLDTLPAGQVPLLPVLYANLTRFGLAEATGSRLKGIHRRSWYARQLVLEAAKLWLQRLETGGVPVMLADAPALALTAYGNRSRPPDPFALIVSPEHASAATRILLAEGGQPLPPVTAWTGREPLWTTRQTFRMAATTQLLELHWHVAPFWPSDALDAAAWSRAQSIALGERSVPALNAADQLVRSSVIAAGSGYASLMALADMAVLLGTVSDVAPGAAGMDWEVVLQVAETGRANRALLAALECLESTLDLAAPAEVMARLRVGRRARYEVLVATPNRDHAAALSTTRRLYAQYRRVLSARGMQPGWGLFLDFLQHRWGLRRRREIFQHAVARLFR